MHATDLIVIAIAVFILGTAVGVVALVSIGIRREERVFRERRRIMQESGQWPGPGMPKEFFPEVPPDWVTHGARALTCLFVRRERPTEPVPVPWHQRRV